MDDFDIVIKPGGVLMTGHDRPALDGMREGFVADRWRNGVHYPEPFGFGYTRADALGDLMNKLEGQDDTRTVLRANKHT
jgi:hypothetical protein